MEIGELNAEELHVKSARRGDLSSPRDMPPKFENELRMLSEEVNQGRKHHSLKPISWY
jgi:hypothetical protein